MLDKKTKKAAVVAALGFVLVVLVGFMLTSARCNKNDDSKVAYAIADALVSIDDPSEYEFTEVISRSANPFNKPLDKVQDTTLQCPRCGSERPLHIRDSNGKKVENPLKVLCPFCMKYWLIPKKYR